MDDRQAQLEESSLSAPGAYQPYSVGRITRLRQLGNPFYGGDGEWTGDQQIGTAWVAFTRSVRELDELLAKPDPLAAFNEIWEETLLPDDFERFYKWMLKQAGLTEAAETEAVKDTSLGKSSESDTKAIHQTS